jgi:hypothetical protein
MNRHQPNNGNAHLVEPWQVLAKGFKCARISILPGVDFINYGLPEIRPVEAFHHCSTAETPARVCISLLLSTKIVPLL